ncbi:MAG: NERD domain-containing protein [Chloroflexota bacterium]|nr:NERD domain-containing protein [Chloroflexota bacterium]
MAEFLMNDGWPEPDSLGAILSETLPDDYVVVERPTVQGHALDMVVVGSQGLFVLHLKDWAGEVRPVPGKPWQVITPDGQPGTYPDPAAEAQKNTAFLATFARDELRSQEAPAIYHLLVLTNPDARLVPGVAPDMMVTFPGNVVSVIVTMPVPSVGGLPDRYDRRNLAHALHARRLSASQRTKTPFIFRSGGLFGGKKAWTVRDAVQHMDRHPEVGIYHLNNGTLQAWLEAEGALDLADLAQQVLQGRESDPRVPLEMFLIGTGLVDRPRLNVHPWPLNLGCVVSGGSCRGRVKIRKGPGRGYLFGNISASQPWLQVEPRSFSGGPQEAVITVDTSSLPISATPWQADLLIDSSAATQPVAVPVQVRVSGEPATLSRYGLRPLLDGLVAGLVGGGIGALLGEIGGLAAPASFTSPTLFWALAIGLLWAVFGLVRGLGQRTAWTVPYATMRYLVKIILWMLALGATAVVGLLLWNALSGRNGPELATNDGLQLVLITMGLSIIPATVSEMRAARLADDSPLSSERRSLLQPGLVALAAMALIAALSAGIRLASPTWNQLTEAGTIETAESWLEQGLQELNDATQQGVDQVNLWLYDRPGEISPAVTPTPPASLEGE